jgi:hypothetical protein
MTAQAVDLNGYIEIKGNPISKVGVFPYLGREIGAPDPDAVYYVYRPEEELASPEAIESFKLMPLVDEHSMLGSEDEGLTPAERKGVQGVIGEDVYFDPPYLRGNIKLYSEAAKGLVKSGAKRELSPGYRCIYDFTPGVFDGQKYDAIQRTIRANHLALVEEGRTGPDVAVLDHMRFALDSNQLKEAVMADENMSGGEASAKIKELLDQLKPLIAEQESVRGMMEEMGIKLGKADESEGERVEEVEKAMGDEEVTAEVVEDEEVVEVKTEDKCDAMDALRKQVADLTKRLAQVQDSGALIASIADRDALANKVSDFVGTFDHAHMTASQVAEYGVKKLGIPCSKGQERVALDAWMHGRTPEYRKPTFAADSSAKVVDLQNLWKEA